MFWNIREFIPEVSGKLKYSYNKDTLDEVNKLLVNDQAVNRKSVEWITIDWIESKDLDDGIWAEKRKDWWYTIWVSIADVAEVIEPFSALDYEALDRATSIYLKTHTLHMFPEKISTDICSLNWWKETLTMTTQIDLDSEFNTTNTQIYESTFYNKNRFDYESFWDTFLNTDSEFHEQLHLQSIIAKWLYKKRLWKNIITNFKDDDIIIKWSYKGWNTKHLASLTVQEFMIKTNIESTIEYIKNKVNTISRNHMPDFQWKSLPKYLERAYYSEKMKYHLWLQEKYYWHNTSPIRRYADLINQRQVKNYIRNEQTIFSKNDIRLLCEYINLKITAIRFAQKEHDYKAKSTIKIKQNQTNTWKNPIYDEKLWYKSTIQRINHGINNWYRIPNIILKWILKKTKEQNWVLPDWVIKVFLPSNETKFKKTIKSIILKDPRTKRYLNIIGSINWIKIEEKEIIKNWKWKKLLKITFNWEIIFNKSSEEKDIENDKSLSWVTYKIRKDALEEVLNYFINN